MNKTTYKRPESVLVLVHTVAREVLLLRRVRPAAFWQSVTGSLRWDETEPLVTAYRELSEETGIQAEAGTIIDCQATHRFPIKPAWQHRYAPGTRFNIEYVFRLEVSGRMAIQLNPSEHTDYLWLPREQAADKATSYTNRDAILQFI